jgi:putative DNA primase/helicase
MIGKCDICHLDPCQTPGFCAHSREAERKEQAEDYEREILRLADLAPLEYERERTEAAKVLGMRTRILDGAVAAARADTEYTKGRGRPLELPNIEPWPGAVDGAELLNNIVKAIACHLIAPEGSTEAMALWAVHTHAFDRFTHSPRLAITSPERGCGKTTALCVG